MSSEVAAATAQGGTSTSSGKKLTHMIAYRTGSMINISMGMKKRFPFVLLVHFDHDRRHLLAEPAVTKGAAGIAGCPAANAVMARIWHRK
ncbi:hypothetical protein SAY87_011630 [Trapa incisa]|uniref:Uncharacterized protein n=1 Tax=Trapa incisa TaxID=236973 RepID=A0AAN7GIU0_9MYRT|nr:hypothetical protein SAY87_011630 [Trapa incisa]